MNSDFNPDYNIPEHLQHMIDNGISALDIMHGELKNLMYEGELQLEETQRREVDSGQAIASMERTYAEGYLDALEHLYTLTYQLSFAMGDK